MIPTEPESRRINRALIVGLLLTVVALGTMGPGLRTYPSAVGTILLGVSGAASVGALVFLTSASFRGLRYLRRRR